MSPKRALLIALQQQGLLCPLKGCRHILKIRTHA
jgi:hypothetical protein